MDLQPTIVLYGATGYTGRLIAAELASTGAPFAIAGRSRDKLDALAATLPPDASVEVKVAPADDPAALSAAFEGAAAVISAAGPFTTMGLPVAEAAVAAGAAYCDTTGEPGFMRDLAERHGDAAVPVVPAVGFDYVPHDLAATVAVAGLDDPASVDTVETVLLVQGMAVTRGTAMSAAGIMADEQLGYVEGAWRRQPFGATRRPVAFPAPFGSRYAVSYPGGDSIQIQAHIPARTVRSCMAMPAYARYSGPVLGFFGRIGSSGPVGALLTRMANRLPEGPSDERRAGARFCVLADAIGADGNRTRANCTGADVYGLTAVLASRIGRILADGEAPSGFRAPAEVIGDPHTFAKDVGIRLEVL